MTALSDNPDAQLIEVCRQMLANWHEEMALLDWGEYAGQDDDDALDAIRAEFASLEAALTKTARPVTPEGIRLLAEVAMLFADRTSDEKLSPPVDFAGWVRLFALTSAARMPETIPLPLPHNLPRYWPPNDAT